MKKLIFLLFTSLVLFTPKIKAIEPTSNFYVNDYANILSEETENYIQTNSVKLAEATTAQIVVVTVPTLNGESLEEYSTKLFRDFGIGDKEKNNGLLILIALEERQSRIEVGYGLEGRLPDGKTGRIQDEYMIPYYKNNNFDEGILNGYKALFKEVAEEYNYDASDVNPISISSDEDEDDALIDFLAYLLVGKFIFTIIVFGMELETFALKRNNFLVLETITGVLTYGSYQLAGEAAFMLLLIGTFFNILAVLIYIPGSSSGGGYSSGGYHGGGGGFHSSGGYHGCGGSSGGGGSSRSF